MNLSEYFEKTKGTGVLATADGTGRVNAAVYGRPHVLDEQTVAFIMADRLTHENLQANPSAAFLFVEEAEGYHGKRLHLRKTGEESDPDKIESIRRRHLPRQCLEDGGKRFLVTFQVEKVRPLTGD